MSFVVIEALHRSRRTSTRSGRKRFRRRAHDLDARFEPVETRLKTVKVYDVTSAGFGGHPVKGWLVLPAGADNPPPPTRGWAPPDCFFDPGGRGSPRSFVEAWQRASTAVASSGFISLPTANHDFSRLNCGPRTAEQLPAAFAFQLTWPTLPAIYYGDEIGMRYADGLPDKEGSVLGPRCNRAGSHTPMQWDDTPTRPPPSSASPWR